MLLVCFLILTICSGVIFIANIITAIYIIRGKHSVLVSTIHAIKRNNRYSPASDYNKAIVLDNMSIAISENQANSFNVGDDVLLVFLPDREYPIIIEKYAKKTI
jgi:hypothetical protein